MMKDLNFRTFDLNLLRVLDEVMVERNLTRAAHNLAMTQPAVSNALRRLREQLGDDLVRRSGFGVEPTPLALTIWPTVRDALQQLQASLAPGGFDPARAENHFVLAMADATAARLLPDLLACLGHDAPGITLRVRPLTTRDPRSLLEAGEIDLAIGHFPGVLAELGATHLQESVPRYGVQRLYQDEYVVVMRRGHPLSGQVWDLDTYCEARHLLVSFSGRPFGFVDEALAAVSRRRRVVLTVNQFFAAARVVAESDLLAVLPRHFLRGSGWFQVLESRPVPLPMPTVQVDMLWHRQTQAVSAQAWLRAQVAQAIAAEQGARLPEGEKNADQQAASAL